MDIFMNFPFFSYTAEELTNSPKIPLEIFPDNQTIFQRIADEMISEIVKNNDTGKHTVLICPVGPVGQYPFFVQQVNERKLSLKSCWFINMDEYLTDERQWISSDHPLSFRGFMAREVYGKIKPELLMPEEQRVFPDPGDPGRISTLITSLGGVDAVFGGIGINGHLAFNEAQDALSAEDFSQLPTRVLEISPETRTANAIGDLNGAIDAMPRFCVTVGMREILSARKIVVGCFREWHRAVVRQACFGTPSGHFPATLLQTHPDARILLTELVASNG